MHTLQQALVVQVLESKEHLSFIAFKTTLIRNGDKNVHIKIITTDALGIYTQLGMYKKIILKNLN